MPENADQEIENYIRQGQQFTQNEEDDAAERVFLLAWNLFVDTYHYRIFQLCYMQCDRQQEDAEDITQETFLGAYKAMAKLRFDASLYTWLCAIAKNQCRAWWRKQQKVVGHKETLKDTPHVEPPRPDEVQVRQEDIQQIRHFLLSPHQNCFYLFAGDRVFCQILEYDYTVAFDTNHSRNIAVRCEEPDS